MKSSGDFCRNLVGKLKCKMDLGKRNNDSFVTLLLMSTVPYSSCSSPQPTCVDALSVLYRLQNQQQTHGKEARGGENLSLAAH